MTFCQDGNAGIAERYLRVIIVMFVIEANTTAILQKIIVKNV